MSFAKTEVVSVTTNSSGAATAYTADVYTGRVLSVAYTKTDFATGVDFTITTADTGQNVWVESDVNASKTVSPRQATHATDGTASLYAGSGEPVEDYVWVVNERLKFVIAQGGDTKTGSFRVIVG